MVVGDDCLDAFVEVGTSENDIILREAFSKGDIHLSMGDSGLVLYKLAEAHLDFF